MHEPDESHETYLHEYAKRRIATGERGMFVHVTTNMKTTWMEEWNCERHAKRQSPASDRVDERSPSWWNRAKKHVAYTGNEKS